MLLTLTLLHILYTVHYNYGVHVIAGKNKLMGHGDIDKMIFFDTTIFGLVLQATAVYTQVTVDSSPFVECSSNSGNLTKTKMLVRSTVVQWISTITLIYCL